MNTTIDYRTERKGWVLFDPSTEDWFLCGDCHRGGYRTSADFTEAYFFPSKAKAVSVAKSAPLADRKWIALPASVSYEVDFSRGCTVKGRRAK